MDDEEDGSFWDRLQDRVLAASIRTVVSQLTLGDSSITHLITGPSKSAVTLISQERDCRCLYASRVHSRISCLTFVSDLATVKWNEALA
jgi:hypothetical protein